MVEKKIFCVPSNDGVHNLSGVVYLPSGEVKGLFHVVHGMTEHMARYDRFLSDSFPFFEHPMALFLVVTIGITFTVLKF